MSINPLLTNYGPNVSLYAPAGSGGGGGGGSNYPANAVFSSITTGLAQVSTIQSGSAPMLLDGQGNAITFAASAVNIPGAPTNISTLVVSSINGAAPGGGGSVGPNLSLSTLTVSSVNAQTIQAASFTGNLIAPNYNGSAYTALQVADPTVSDGAWATLELVDAAAGDGDIKLTFTGYRTTGSYRPQLVIQTQSQASSNDLPCLIGTGGSGAQIAIENVSSINNLPYPAVPVNTMTTFNGTQMPGGFQCGYADNVPYTGVITFPHPYPDDKVCVMMTPTNAGVSGGANPNLSLNTNYGVNGVSSVGFGTDFRNGGVGATGSFFWMAYPWTI